MLLCEWMQDDGIQSDSGVRVNVCVYMWETPSSEGAVFIVWRQVARVLPLNDLRILPRLKQGTELFALNKCSIESYA